MADKIKVFFKVNYLLKIRKWEITFYNEVYHLTHQEFTELVEGVVSQKMAHDETGTIIIKHVGKAHGVSAVYLARFKEYLELVKSQFDNSDLAKQ